MSNEIADIRKDYKLASLEEADVAANPIDQFTRWWNEAVALPCAHDISTMCPHLAPRRGVGLVLLPDWHHIGNQHQLFLTNFRHHFHSPFFKMKNMDTTIIAKPAPANQ